MANNIFCTLKEEVLKINLAEDSQSIFVEIPEAIKQRINCTIKEENLNFTLSQSDSLIRVTITGGLKGEEGHTHANKEMLDSLRYDVFYRCYLLRDN